MIEVRVEVYGGRVAIYDTVSWRRGMGKTVEEAIASHRAIVADTWYLTDDDRLAIEAEYAVIRNQAAGILARRMVDELGGVILSGVARVIRRLSVIVDRDDERTWWRREGDGR